MASGTEGSNGAGNGVAGADQGAAGTGTPQGGGEDIAAIFQFDPFAKPPAEGAPSGDAEKAAPKSDATPPADKKGAAAPGKETPAPAGTSKPGAAAPDAAKPAAQAPDLAKLFAEQTAAIRSLVDTKATPQAKDTDTAAPPKYNLGIPDKLIQAMASEDVGERTMATQALVSGVANMVWKDAEAMVREQVGQVLQSIPQIIESHTAAREQQRQIFTDFYGAHQNLNKPELQGLVLSAAQMVFQEHAQAGKPIAWGPELRDAIAERIYGAVPGLRATAAAPGNGNGSAAPGPAAPRFVPGGGARPGGGSASPDNNDMLQVLGLTAQ